MFLRINCIDYFIHFYLFTKLKVSLESCLGVMLGKRHFRNSNLWLLQSDSDSKPMIKLTHLHLLTLEDFLLLSPALTIFLRSKISQSFTTRMKKIFIFLVSILISFPLKKVRKVLSFLMSFRMGFVDNVSKALSKRSKLIVHLLNY